MERIEREEEELRWIRANEVKARAAHTHEVNLVVVAMLDQERKQQYGGSNLGRALN